MDGIWESFLNIVRQESGSRIVDTWFKALALHRWDALERIIYLKAPNQFVSTWIQRNYMSMIYRHMGRLLNVELNKIIILDGQSLATLPVPTEQQIQPARACHSPTLSIKRPVGTQVNQQYSFADFVVGPNNSLAYAAAHAVTEKPGSLYNPLFIYGGSGLGKTHLLHAIGNEVKNRHKNTSILYQTTDRFVNEFISAIRFDRVHKFQEKYRQVDVLLIDDIQFISNKDQTQEAFFHIFNVLYEARKQIVFSGDVYPQNLEGIADRLRSRLASGMVADIVMPPLETKVAIIKKKAETQGIAVEDIVAHTIADYTVTSIRELEGFLLRVIAYASLMQQPITQELIYKVLGSPATVTKVVSEVSMETIVQCMQKYYAYTLADLRSDKRVRELVTVRHMAMFLMKRITKKSLRDIATFLGGRNHATVVHAIDRVEQNMQVDPTFKQHVMSLEHEIRNY